MVHSFLIVGGTVKKRKLEARDLKLEKNLETRGWKNRGGDVVAADPWSAPSPPTDNKFDTTILEPEEDKQTITIDQVRDLQHQLSLRPYAAKFKTGIILEAQRMTVEAQNALLKTLEEPPAHSVLILTAPSAKNLLPTIVSRCQIVRLRAEIDLDLESEEYQKGVEEFLELLGSGRGERLAWVEENKSALSSQPSALSTLDVWISVLRDLLLINSGCQSLTLNSFNGSSNSLTPSSNSSNSFKPSNLPNPKNSSNTSALCSAEVLSKLLTRALERTIETKNLIASTNVSPHLALEVLLLDLPNFRNF